MSSGGARLQVIAQGKQDVFLTGNPQFTFFKTVYTRHTNFALESKAIMFDGTPNFGQRITCTIPRHGDLLSKLYLEVKLPNIVDLDGNRMSYTHNIGHALIKEISVQIGEQEIDRQTGEWMEIWSRLTTPSDHRPVMDKLVGGAPLYQVPHIGDGVGADSSTNTVMIPLQFWFCRSYGLALPLLALQHHTVRINIKLRSLDELFHTSSLTITEENECGDAIKRIETSPKGSLPTFLLWADYVHLDVEETRRFAKNDHEYLITQVQYTQPISVPCNALKATIPIDFNHPVKELIWVVQRDICRARNELFNWSSAPIFNVYDGSVPSDNIQSATLMIDGKERFEERDASYFRLIQPYQHHTRVDLDYFIYVYSFGLTPEKIQPSGSLNMSLMNSVTLNLAMSASAAQVTGSASTATVYGLNNNVLRVTNGCGGLVFKV
jgi:hypothetical protein